MGIDCGEGGKTNRELVAEARAALAAEGGLDKIVLDGPILDEDFVKILRDLSNLFKDVGNLDEQGRRTASYSEMIGVFTHVYGPVYSTERMKKAIGIINGYMGVVPQAVPASESRINYSGILTANPESDPE